MDQAPGNHVTTEQTAWIEQAAGRLRADGYTDLGEVVVHGRTVRALRRKDFKVQWLFTQIHTFVVFDPMDQVDAGVLSAFSQAAGTWAKSVKGGLPLGFQTGIVLFPVLVAQHASPAAHEEAQRVPGKNFGALHTPILVETATRSISHYTGSMLWGVIYQSFIAAQRRLITGQN
jgi:hypothetical protein